LISNSTVGGWDDGRPLCRAVLDQENARYLGKGLYAAGIRRSDVVVNFLSAGFWGGMHVFNLALSYTGEYKASTSPASASYAMLPIIQYPAFSHSHSHSTGCAVVPLGPTFSSEDVVTFLRQLRPTALLGMPSTIMTLADHVAQLADTEGEPTAPIVISKVITGGNANLVIDSEHVIDWSHGL